jgi:hypothetical protein
MECPKCKIKKVKMVEQNSISSPSAVSGERYYSVTICGWSCYVCGTWIEIAPEVKFKYDHRADPNSHIRAYRLRKEEAEE